MRLFCLLFTALLLCASCQKYYVQVTREKINRQSLASTFAKTPDPRQSSPPKGERLIIQWNLMQEDVKDYVCKLSLIYRNYEQETIYFSVERERDVFSYFLLGEKYEKTGGIMTYKVEILSSNKEIVQSFKHQLWTNLIVIEED